MGEADYVLKCKKTESGVVVKNICRPFWGELSEVRPRVSSTIKHIGRIGGKWEFVLYDSNDEIVSLEPSEPTELR